MMTYSETDYKVAAVSQLLNTLRPNAKWACAGYTYEGLQWIDEDQTKPTRAEWDAGFDDAVAAVKLSKLRMQRDIFITETDWWVLPDRTPTQEQLDYRQALRDITDHYSSLDDVVWPEKAE